jgi:hypothetical protein
MWGVRGGWRGVTVRELARCSTRLLILIADLTRSWWGEYERAFAADQFERMAPLLERYGVRVWLPEAGGPVEIGTPLHHVLMTVLGAQSQREVLRARHRTLTALRAQASGQGRYLGGRPPYGYRLVDAGPHPNRAHARWGRRLQRLDPDPATAAHVRWIFTERLAGRSAAGIARVLNERGVPCPSQVDPVRNRHRMGQGWSLRTVVEILRNPRYTGRQVWNRVSADRDHRHPDRGRRGPSRRLPQAWAISAGSSHPALVSEQDFIAAQSARVKRTPGDGSVRVYRLSGLVRCGLCARRMDSHWVNDRPGYRCRHGHASARLSRGERPKTLYLREDKLLARIAARLADQGDLAGPDPGDVVAYLRAHDVTVVCDADTLALKRNVRAMQ